MKAVAPPEELLEATAAVVGDARARLTPAKRRLLPRCSGNGNASPAAGSLVKGPSAQDCSPWPGKT
eukprot:CAMPEP_0180482964 /NCGR_PEP_ID=MMETSP1036_2-20121128/35176_1 /TAXON_ID=632150 /ORGANISM="Azadinium spinosum, Strain 3D9" /LENGTH=65 /DNA_ID=CAMNT_0022490753 /DNA_START=304 /DNA_END=497 /DNA_ORIENTATION=+